MPKYLVFVRRDGKLKFQGRTTTRPGGLTKAKKRKGNPCPPKRRKRRASTW